MYFQFWETVNEGAVTIQIIFEKSGLWLSQATREAEKVFSFSPSFQEDCKGKICCKWILVGNLWCQLQTASSWFAVLEVLFIPGAS